MPTTPDPSLIAYCGLYCANCRSYRTGTCLGCAHNEKATWCQVRTCCLQHNYTSCADCSEHATCPKLHHWISRLIGWATGTDRRKCMDEIAQRGYDGYAAYMSENGWQSMPRHPKK